MKSFKVFLFSALLLGWLASESLAAPAAKKQQGKSLGQDKEDGDGDQDQEKGKGKGQGSDSNTPAKESANTYVEWGDNNMANVQTKMDTHFVKKKKEGDAIEQYGDKSRTENEALQQKMENSQDASLQAGMQWTDKEVQDAEENLLKDGKGKGNKGGNDDEEGEDGEGDGEDGKEVEGEDEEDGEAKSGEEGTTGQSGRSMKGKGKGKESNQSGRGMKGKGKDTSQSGRGMKGKDKESQSGKGKGKKA